MGFHDNYDGSILNTGGLYCSGREDFEGGKECPAKEKCGRVTADREIMVDPNRNYMTFAPYDFKKGTCKHYTSGDAKDDISNCSTSDKGCKSCSDKDCDDQAEEQKTPKFLKECKSTYRSSSSHPNKSNIPKPKNKKNANAVYKGVGSYRKQFQEID